jgi:hypothetical protein
MRGSAHGGLWPAMKILFAGNSHVGAIKQALSINSNANDINCASNSFSFCATVGGQGMIADGNYIYIDPSFHDFSLYSKHFLTVAGASRISYLGFDAIFLVGGESPLDIRQYLCSHEVPHPFSLALVRGIVSSLIELAFKQNPFFAPLVNSDAQKFWIPNPCEPCTLNSILKSGHCPAPRWRNSKYYPCLDDYSCNEYFSKLYHVITQAVSEISLSYGFQGALLPAPKLLTSSFFQTKEIYSRGSMHFANEGAESDVDPHMNAEYGWQILLQAFNDLLNRNST